ncbi:MAG TPA: nucleotidyltransferase family protein [Chloroflexota bacterium]|jgi:predicted nucleotidyltransferase|nr:nucleotidyltransferase family protein [Chloroflexota bacterium]
MPADMMHALQINTGSIEAFCNRWKISELSLFGSVLRADFRPDSDVDILVQFARDASWGLLDLAAMERELAEILGRSVDIVTRGSLEQSRNQIFRAHVLANVRPIFLA